MGFLINFLLISGISFIIVETTKSRNIQNEISDLFSNGLPSASVADNLKLLHEGFISDNELTLIWKGIYNDTTNVACKIFFIETLMERELKVYETLNPTGDPSIEEQGIPKIYYHGNILDGKYHAVAMTLFDGTLYDRYMAQNQNLSVSNILMIFKQAVKRLQYLNNKDVVHNDITPYSIFLRGAKVFLGDFEMASLNRGWSIAGTVLFASRKYFLDLKRTAKDDLESLLYTIWFIANVPIARSLDEGEPIGFILRNLNEEEAKSKMLEKCKHFKNEYVYQAMEPICADVVSSESEVPNYQQIIDALKVAINKLKGSSEPPKVKLLTDVDAAKSSEA